MTLTPHQRRVLVAIDHLRRQHNSPLTFEEVGDYLGISKSGVAFHVGPLRRAGLVVHRGRGIPRALTLTLAGLDALRLLSGAEVAEVA